MLEKEFGEDFVAGFSQANVGDTSPNTQGAFCQDTGLPCKYEDSTCDGKAQQCWGRGPAFPSNDTESCHIIATKQAKVAKSLHRDTTSHTPIIGKVRSLHTYTDFSTPYTFTLPNGTEVTTCAAALGFSFAGGTTDGPGAFDFTQNNPGAPKNPFWLLVRNLLHTPGLEQRQCHQPKPILLDVGEMSQPYAWTPNIVDFQLFRVGQLGIIVSPGEATTMSGRRWRNKLSSELTKLGVESPWVVIGGPANSYTHYIATPEEYSVQRYEGASTLYGPHTLNAYIHLTARWARYLGDTLPSYPIPTGPEPPINTNRSISLITGVALDSPPFGKRFGQVLKDAASSSYSPGDTVAVHFVGANPRNDLHLEGTYVAVEKKVENGGWKRVRDDTDWALTMKWVRTVSLTGQSRVEVSWTVEKGSIGGWYRLKYYGDAKVLGGKVRAFEGVSGEFRIMDGDERELI